MIVGAANDWNSHTPRVNKRRKVQRECTNSIVFHESFPVRNILSRNVSVDYGHAKSIRFSPTVVSPEKSGTFLPTFVPKRSSKALLSCFPAWLISEKRLLWCVVLPNRLTLSKFRHAVTSETYGFRDHQRSRNSHTNGLARDFK